MKDKLLEEAGDRHNKIIKNIIGKKKKLPKEPLITGGFLYNDAEDEDVL